MSYGLGTDQHGPHFFDSTLVGVLRDTGDVVEEARRRDFVAFTQAQEIPTHSSDVCTSQTHFVEVYVS